jgi:hypothetical protein
VMKFLLHLMKKETTMAKTLYFPPVGVVLSKTTKVSDYVKWGDPLTIIFTATGYLTHDDKTAFYPDLPTGNFIANNVIGPYLADNKDHTVHMVFLDADGNSVDDKVTINKSGT